MTDLSAHGISVTVPSGWEGRVFRRPAAGEVMATAADGPPAPPGEITNAVVHVSTIALPPDAGDFASGAVDRLGPDDALVVVFEYDAASVHQPLFTAVGIPRALSPDDFSPGMLQRTLPGQAGAQRFFQEAGRAFCLYVVLGSFVRRREMVGAVNEVLASLEVGGPAPMPNSTAPNTTVPAPAILDLVGGTADLTTFATLLSSGDARTLLTGPGPLTVFAPDNDAFAIIDLAALRRDPERLARTLEHHVVVGAYPTSTLTHTSTVSPHYGDPLPIEVAGDDRVVVGGVPIVRPDLPATNGVVHVVTGVLELPR